MNIPEPPGDGHGTAVRKRPFVELESQRAGRGLRPLAAAVPNRHPKKSATRRAQTVSGTMTEAPAAAEASRSRTVATRPRTRPQEEGSPMADSIVQPEMINRTAYEELRAADMPEDQAKAVAAHLPDWSQFATKQGLAELESRLIRWMRWYFPGHGQPAGRRRLRPGGRAGLNRLVPLDGWHLHRQQTGLQRGSELEKVVAGQLSGQTQSRADRVNRAGLGRCP